jgi:hypothetical protein
MVTTVTSFPESAEGRDRGDSINPFTLYIQVSKGSES